eukprot:2870791-Prymnesium_polylepis.1
MRSLRAVACVRLCPLDVACACAEERASGVLARAWQSSEESVSGRRCAAMIVTTDALTLSTKAFRLQFLIA